MNNNESVFATSKLRNGLFQKGFSHTFVNVIGSRLTGIDVSVKEINNEEIAQRHEHKKSTSSS